MANTRRGPLDGLRVVELTDETGRFAGKLLAESGASVARIGRPVARSGHGATPSVAARGGLLDWWLEGGKRWIDARPRRRPTAWRPTGAWPSTPTW